MHVLFGFAKESHLLGDVMNNAALQPNAHSLQLTATGTIRQTHITDLGDDGYLRSMTVEFAHENHVRDSVGRYRPLGNRTTIRQTVPLSPLNGTPLVCGRRVQITYDLTIGTDGRTPKIAITGLRPVA